MKILRTRLGIGARRDAGLGLVEILVAMMIFALISVALAGAMVVSLQVTDAAKRRVVAANLASSAIDVARFSSNLLALTGGTTDTVVDGATYHVKVDTRWIGSESGSVGQCSAGTGSLRYKSVNVHVTWDGAAAGSTGVRADTQVAPAKRVNDPNKGVIVVSVKLASGAPAPGIQVKASVASPTNGATAIADTPLTDAQGCAYFLNVIPGNYNVAVAMGGMPLVYLDSFQNTAPSLPATVSTGGSAAPAFQFDKASTFTPRLASNVAPGSFVLPMVPLQISAVNGYGIWLRQGTAPVRLHPYTAGYSFLAGKVGVDNGSASSCQSVDPAAWPEFIDVTGTYAATRKPIATEPGESTDVDIPMGVATVTGTSNGFIKAVAQSAPPPGISDPGCTAPSTYVYRLPAGGVANLALPFGSWVLTSGDSASQTTAVAAAAINPVTRGAVTVVGATAVLTMDPRELVPVP